MNGFLEQVIKEKEIEVTGKKRSKPEAGLVRPAAALPIRNFRKALSGGGKIIAEIKKKSPSLAAFRQKVAVERLASIYEENGASAISIVTDERNFGTSLADVRRVRGAVSLPLLVKDFIIDDYQVIEANAAGADAVLLIARILTPPMLAGLLSLTRRLGISALVECHDPKDLEKAIASGADIIGINNRDLKTLEISLESTRKLVSRIPNGALSISESGIETRAQIQELCGLGVDAFLIGTSLLKSNDPGGKLGELCGRMQEGKMRERKGYSKKQGKGKTG